MKTLLRLAVALLATTTIGCANGARPLVSLYGFDHTFATPALAEEPAGGEGAIRHTVCRPVLERTAEATPIDDPFLE